MNTCSWCGRLSKISGIDGEEYCTCGQWDVQPDNGAFPVYCVPRGAMMRLPPFSFMMDGRERAGYWHLKEQKGGDRVFIPKVSRAA